MPRSRKKNQKPDVCELFAELCHHVRRSSKTTLRNNFPIKFLSLELEKEKEREREKTSPTQRYQISYSHRK